MLAVSLGLFYGGYGTVMIPSFGIVESYGGLTPEYYNAFGLFILSEYRRVHTHSCALKYNNNTCSSLGCAQHLLPNSFYTFVSFFPCFSLAATPRNYAN